MENLNVLVFPCGSEIGIEIWRSLKDIRFITLFGASSVRDHGSFVYRNYIEGVPFLDDPAFRGELKKIVEDNDIDVIFPALDSAIPVLTEMSDELSCPIIEPSHETAVICRDKSLTYEKLGNAWFNVRSFDYAAGDWPKVDEYPVIIKPALGQGSQGFKVIESEEALRYELSMRSSRQVVCEYLSGDEYTVDCFTDRFGNLLLSSQRVRARTKAGISVNSHLEAQNDVIRGIAEEINSRLSFRGVWFFQLKRNARGEYRLLEIAPRVAGTMCLERAVGVNLPLLSVLDAVGCDVEIVSQVDNCEVDRSFDCVYNIDCEYDSVYIDFDDTIVTDGEVNLGTICFLYQCVNKGIPIFLITRHADNIEESLARAKISISLFDGIFHVDKDSKKSDYIARSGRPILVDDSFAERMDVHRSLGIKTFGVDALEALMDIRH